MVRSALYTCGNQDRIWHRCGHRYIQEPSDDRHASTHRQNRVPDAACGGDGYSLFGTLQYEDVNAYQLLNVKIHRVLVLARDVRQIFLLWDLLVAWYEERTAKIQRENVAPPLSFPLARGKMELIQVLSLLEPISVINRIGQSEFGKQCNVLLGLYKLRIALLDVTTPLKDCRSTKMEKRFFRPVDLSNMVTTTRALRQKAFHRVFFRHTDREVMNSCSNAFERCSYCFTPTSRIQTER